MHCIKRVACGVSGGVDSAVAAYILKRKGYDVTGVFMQNWDLTDETGFCTVERDREDAEWVCKNLQMPLHHASFVKEYWNNVFSNLLQDYESGLTPNPDILCNKEVKFGAFYKYAMEKLQVNAVATGHYARTTFGKYLENYDEAKGAHLLKAVDPIKDQTFFLSQIPQEALQKTMFPLGKYTKEYVKKMAIDIGLGRLVKKKESTGICFIGSRKFQQFISEYINNTPGKFVDIDSGEMVGEHNGIHQWTLGQRCRIPGQRKAYYVARKNPKNQIIHVAAGNDHSSLFTRTLYTEAAHWIHSPPLILTKGKLFHGEFRFQHTKPLVKCSIQELPNGNLEIELAAPLRALTPGQFATFYSEDECLGSARILYVGASVTNFVKASHVSEM